MSFIREYTKDSEGNILDPITYNVIPLNRLVDIEEGKNHWYFDIDTLYRDSSMLNPYTRQPFRQDIQDMITQYKESKDVNIHLYSSRYCKGQTFTVPYYKTLGDLIVTIISRSSRVSGQPFKVFLTNDIVSTSSNRSLYEGDMNSEVSLLSTLNYIHKADLSNKKTIDRLVVLGIYCCKTVEGPYSDKHIIAETIIEIEKHLPVDRPNDKPQETFVMSVHEHSLYSRRHVVVREDDDSEIELINYETETED